jgi:hypothetical protein
MKHKYLLFFLLGFVFIPLVIAAQDSPKDTSGEPGDTLVKKKKTEKRWTFGGLPVLGYNSDIGLQFGVLGNLFDYGDRSKYPKYDQQYYAEVSFTTKGGGIYQFFYDSYKLIKNIRTTANITYLTEQSLDFYGFNGYKAVYNHSWEDDEDTAYLSRVFYRQERKILRIGADFQGKFFAEHLNWLAGFTYFQVETGPVDIQKLNKGKKEDKQLPDTPGLFNLYTGWDILSPTEVDGGTNNYVKLGFIYDTRDNEPNPMKGIWSEVIFLLAPGFISDGEYSFIRLSVIHRQYFTLVKNNLSFAYRIGYMGTIAGKSPYYFLPYMINSYSITTTVDGLGGSQTIRGIKRNRVVGDGVAFVNTELRWKFWHFRFLNRNWYAALNAFIDAGMVVQDRPVDEQSITPGYNPSDYFSNTPEYPHVGVGGGLRLVMDQNFVIAGDVGLALDKRDGDSGVYIGLGYLF